MLHYDQETGIFTWKKSPRYRIEPGQLAGVLAETAKDRFYRYIMVDGVRVRANRLAIFWVDGVWPDGDVAYANGVAGDDRFSNLCVATRQQLSANSHRPRHNSSGYKGVSFNRRKGLYEAYIKVMQKKHHLGFFKCPVEAHQAYKAAAEKAFGRFARAA